MANNDDGLFRGDTRSLAPSLLQHLTGLASRLSIDSTYLRAEVIQLVLGIGKENSGRGVENLAKLSVEC